MNTLKMTLAILLAAATNGCFKLDESGTQQCVATPVSCSGGATLSGCYNASVTVPANATCNVTGLAIMKSGTSLVIGAGATMKMTPGQSPASSVIIDQGATITAIGTAASPITFTSGKDVGQRAAQDWGGLIIRGRATHNFTTATFTTEFDDGGVVGSNNSANDTESSGTLKYVRVEFAGKQATSLKEYNGFTFEAVGSGTTVDFIHAHNVGDDGVEFFGGTVNVKHVISSAFGDDGFDWTYGWRGKAQYVIVSMTDGDSSNDSNGIEADNSDQPNGDNLTTPDGKKSSPTIANMTMVSNNKQWRQIMRLRRGTQGLFYNFYVANWCDTILVEDTAGQGNVTTGNVTAGTLKIQNSLFEGISRNTAQDRAACTGAITTNKDSTGLLNGAGYDALTSVATVTMNAAIGNGFSSANWITAAPTNAFRPSAAITTNAMDPTTLGSFFTSGNYIGAMDTTDWTTGGWATFPTN